MAILSATPANYVSQIAAANPGDVVELAAGNYNLNTGSWGDISNSKDFSSFVWAATLDGWANHILIRPASGAVGSVVMGPHRKNKGGGSVDWPCIFEDIIHRDDESIAATDNTWSGIYDFTTRTGFRRPQFRGNAGTTTGSKQPRGYAGTNAILEDASFLNCGESVGGSGKIIMRRTDHQRSWQQTIQIGAPDGAIVEDLYCSRTKAAPGAHGDVVHLLIQSNPAGTYVVSSLQRIWYWMNDATDNTQGIFGQCDMGTNATSWFDMQGGYIRHVGIVGNAIGGIVINRMKNAIIECCTLLTDLTRVVSSERPTIQLTDCDNIVIRNCVTNAPIQLTNCTNITQSNNVVLDRDLGQQALGFPNIAYGTAVDTFAKHMASITPGVTGSVKLGDGSYAGALKPGPGGVGYALNDRLPVGSGGVVPFPLPGTGRLPRRTFQRILRGR